jgi:hypothetical protein
MTEKPTRRRRRTLLVPLLGIGVAAWAIRSRLAERGTLHDGWQPLPPRRATPDRTAADAPEPEPALEPAAVPEYEPAPRLTLAVPGSIAAAAPEPEPAPEPVPARARAVSAATAVASVTAPALDDGASPGPDYVVKGKTATRVFYAPGSAYYARTRADVWFRTADDAAAAGFTPRAPRRSV